ncbi:MAG: MXAN_5808 family serine peptidase, partial [Myxococcota bacterium]
IKPYEMFLAALDYVQKTVAEVIIDDSETPSRIKVSVGSAERVFDLERLGGLDQLWEVTLALRDIFRFIQSHIQDPERRRDIEYAAINGMLSSLDPHSILLKPESFDEVKLSTKGEFGGLGIVISIRDGALTIISPIGGTPASRAGLKARDKIVKIGEESTVNMGLEEAVSRLRGKAGTKVNIWVLRKAWTEARRFSLTRAIIKIESVTSEMLDNDIGYLKIKSFQANTFDDLHSHLERLRRRTRNGLNGLILDLRNNPGGLLDQAILVSDRFVERGPLVITVGEGNRKRDVKSAHVSGTETDYPIAVLVNGGSASASEIVSGALKNHDRAIVIGQRTFGKGSVQVLYDFKDRSALKLTIAQYLTPGDVSIQSVGIVPDVEIIPATIAKEGIHLFVNDDSPREKDLDHHLETPESAHRGSGGSNSEQNGLLADAAAREPAAHVVHLIDDANSSDDSDDADDAADYDKFVYDFEIRLAHDVLAQAHSTSRPAILAEAADLFAARAAQSEQEIAERLRELGIDWSSGPDTGSPRAAVELEIKGKPTGVVRAGTELVFTATVENAGRSPLYRVYGVTSSDNPLLKNLEFAFGKVDAGEKRRWDVTIKLPKDMSPRADTVTLELSDLHHRIDGADVESLVAIGEVPKPRFAYAYRIDDRKGGNGDGILQVGEHVDMKVDVENIGIGAAGDVVITIKNLSSKAVFLKEGRFKVGALEPGAKSTGILKFSLRSPTDEVKLRVSVWDSVLGELLSEKVKIPVEQGRRTKNDRRLLRVNAEGGASIFIGAGTGVPVLGHARAGALLRAEASIGSRWWRVLVRKGVSGFVRARDVTPQKASGRRQPTANAIDAATPQAAPQIAIDLGSLVTSQSAFRLTGTISDERALRDVYVFVNDKKVYYRSLENLKSTRDGLSTPLDVVLPLKIGSNIISVIARETDELVSRRVFGMFRTTADIVAKRGVPRAVAQ